MPLSGTVPSYDVSLTPTIDQGGVQTAPVTGLVFPASGTASAANSNETLQAFYRRAAGILSISGTLTGGEQVILSAQLSGLAQLQRECALRAADLEIGVGSPNASRLAHANAILVAASGSGPAAGEVQFGA